MLCYYLRHFFLFLKTEQKTKTQKQKRKHNSSININMSSKKGEKKGDRKIKKKTLTPQDEALQHILEFISTTLYPLFSNEHAMKMVPRDEDKDKREQMELAIQAASATFIRSVSLCK